jgi:signal peptidase I
VTTDETEPVRRRTKQLPLWLETILLLGLAIALAIVMKAFFIQAFYIPSQSMEPGLNVNDKILVEKMSYWGGGTPQRGDVVVFQDPGGWLSAEADAGPTNPIGKAMSKIGLYPAGGNLVKRVIGVAGDTVHCCDSKGRIEVNGHPLDESSYLNRDPNDTCNGPQVDGCHGGWTAGPVPPGRLFVMGDNRGDSADSSYHLCHPAASGCGSGNPFVPVSDVVGKVVALLWPAGRFHVVHRPADFAGIPSPSQTTG